MGDRVETSGMDEERRKRLRALLAAIGEGRAGGDERIEAAALLDEAARAGLRPGTSADEVRALLGEPHFTRGEGGDAGWGYPTLARPGDQPPGAAWYLWLELRNGRVASVGRRAWIAG
jgi:hypothetical protein